MRDYILDNPKLKNKSFIAPHLSSYWESPKAPTYRDKIIFRHAGILNKIGHQAFYSKVLENF